MMEDNVEFPRRILDPMLIQENFENFYSFCTFSGGRKWRYSKTPDVILEAAAAGLPVLSTLSAARPTRAKDGKHGFLVK